MGALATPRVRVATAPQLVETLASGFTGVIVVAAGADLDLTGHRNLDVNSGITIVGERGYLCSRPVIRVRDKKNEGPVLTVVGNDVVIRGIHFVGPSAGDYSSSNPYVHAVRVLQDHDAGTGRRILITDNEMEEWTGGGVDTRGTHRVRTPAEYLPTWGRIGPDDAALIRIERNYLHHNARDGGGYGVVVGGGSYAQIMGNVFDYDRHAVAADGFAASGYIARFNYILQSTRMYGGFLGYYGQHFDVHGGKAGGYGGSAGEFFEIAFNTIRGAQTSKLGFKSRPAFELRGRPTIGARFDANVVVHPNLDAAVALKKTSSSTGIGEDHGAFRFSASGNRFRVDHSSDLATGDFDGDGRADVFVATGTAWFFSRGGTRHWEFLHASTKLTRELAFADVDNDGVTDILYRSGDGALGYLKSGTEPLRPLTSLPVPISDLRSGDFDGDGRTDLFYTQRGQWWVWHGASRAWRPAQTSSQPVGQLLIGSFDRRPGTDVVAALSDQWAVSSSATGVWSRLAPRYRSSLGSAVAADVDGDRVLDIVLEDGRDWSWSKSGRARPVRFYTVPLQAVASGATVKPVRMYPTLRALPVGHFEGARAQASFASFKVTGSDKLNRLRPFGTTLLTRPGEHNMR
ncbi:MAG TPA: VCBS repeat-containing protein [Dermatophilaceae bacterium]|nr:VCBS repeat-containing protein [Dermatophilaceae bacterium]